MDSQTAALDHHQPNATPPRAVLSRQFMRAMLDDTRYTDEHMDALEARIVALEELVATRGLSRLCATRRLAQALRVSVRPFAGRSFTQARFEAVSGQFEVR